MHETNQVQVGLKTADQAAELTDLACRVSASGASMLLVHVIELPEQTPLEADVPDLEASAGCSSYGRIPPAWR